MSEQFSPYTRKIAKLVISTLAVLLGIFVAFKLSFYLAPFIIALVLSLLMEPLIKLFINKLKFGRKISSLIALLLILLILGTVVTLIIVKLVSEFMGMAHNLPQFFSDLYNNINALIQKEKDIYNWLPEEVSSNIGSVISELSGSLMKLVNSIVSGTLKTAISLPEALIFVLVTIVSTYFLASDRDKIYGFFRRQLPESWVNKIISLKNDMFSALFGYIRAQLIIMSITFTELFIGLTIIHIKYSLLFALLIGFIDALPILGTGTVLVPWGIYSLLTGNIRMGISIIILYVIVLIVRQLLEPRVLGDQIGVYPLLTLTAMYAGLKLLGFIGLILGPITFLLLKNILTGMFKNKPLRELIKKD